MCANRFTSYCDYFLACEDIQSQLAELSCRIVKRAIQQIGLPVGGEQLCCDEADKAERPKGTQSKLDWAEPLSGRVAFVGEVRP